MKIFILIPCYNEEKYIEKVIDNIIKFAQFDKEIVVIDDGSTDKTNEILNDLKKQDKIQKLLVHSQNQGKGASIRRGLQHVNEGLIIIQDADFEYSPKDYNKLISPIINLDADVVYGSRFLSSNEANRVLFFSHRIANSLLTFFSNLLTNINLTDMETGFKAFKHESIKDIILRENRFGFEPEITAKLAKKKLRIYDVGVSYKGRTYAEGKKIKLKDAFRAVYCIVKYNILN